MLRVEFAVSSVDANLFLFYICFVPVSVDIFAYRVSEMFKSISSGNGALV